ncbi:MAG: phosphoribosylanthranilate isomerase [Bauldia sp.]
MDLTVKICGLSTEATLGAALDAGADMVGFVFFAKSPRFVSVAAAAALAAKARGHAEIAALTVDMDDARLAEIVEAVRPDWLQLHGGETPERVAAIKARFGIRTMKAIGVSTAGDLAVAPRYAAVADRLLLDAKPPKGAALPGGNGAPFDWSLLRGFDAGVPYLLSGGLSPANVGEAIAVTGAPGVDVSSGVETAPGVKDAGLIRAFIRNARMAADTRTLEKVAS